jgi:uncharacterized membrane protein
MMRPMAALKRIRDISSWSVLVMIASLLLAEKYLSSNYVYPYIPHAPPSRWELGWRLVSFFGVIVFSLISLPRWQSILGVVTILLFIYYLQSY